MQESLRWKNRFSHTYRGGILSMKPMAMFTWKYNHGIDILHTFNSF